MLNWFRRHFSNKRVAAEIRRNADQLRDAGIWVPAAKLYKSYLDLRPQDAAIWVQCGHCQKESGLLSEADASYGRAAAITPDVGDVWLQIGHLRKIEGRIGEAAVNYAKALTKEPMLVPARLELEGLGFQPSDIALLTAEPGSLATATWLLELNHRSANLIETNSTVEALGSRIEEVRGRLDEVQQRVSIQSGHIEHLIEFSNRIERLLELMSTVKALGFAVKRQEARAVEAAERFVAIETRLDRFDRLLRDMPVLGSLADRAGRADFAAIDGQASHDPGA